MEKEDRVFDVIAISRKEYHEYGCPYCLYNPRHRLTLSDEVSSDEYKYVERVNKGKEEDSNPKTYLSKCNNCNKKFLTLIEGIEKSTIGIVDDEGGILYPKLIKHPRAHHILYTRTDDDKHYINDITIFMDSMMTINKHPGFCRTYLIQRDDVFAIRFPGATRGHIEHDNGIITDIVLYDETCFSKKCTDMRYKRKLKKEIIKFIDHKIVLVN